MRRGTRWLVWSVLEAEPPTPAAISTDSTMPTATTTSTTSPAPLTSLVEAPIAAAESAVVTESGIKFPILSAWIVVFTFVGVVAAGYLALRLERRELSGFRWVCLRFTSH